ncbi:MAG: hypothetical protein AUJ54_11660 [Ignavibacteria bacterium CG1_02_37_35]|nr:MAG: hypothetical protein AUJ54_11660 [Ignavibacteria bacterium CG1_02_37_35]
MAEEMICMRKGEYERLIKIAGETIKSKNTVKPNERLGELNQIHIKTELQEPVTTENGGD